MAQTETQVEMVVIDGVRYQPEHVAAAKAAQADQPADTTKVEVGADGSSTTTSTGPLTEGALVDEVARDKAAQERLAETTATTAPARTGGTRTTRSTRS